MPGQLTFNSCDVLRKRYLSAEPFPYLVMDDVFPEDELMQAYSDWPIKDDGRWGILEKGRFSSLKRGAFNCASAPKRIAAILKLLNGLSFLKILSSVTGIDSLIADPKFRGAGLHETFREGFLLKHVDFNRLGDGTGIPKPTDPYRRLNLFLYLNPEWQDEWNGHLCLWKNKGDKYPAARIAPLFNRLVICEASERSWHGHPEPLNCSEDRSRRSMAWYFYTKSPPETFKKRHSTVYVR